MQQTFLSPTLENKTREIDVVTQCHEDFSESRHQSHLVVLEMRLSTIRKNVN